jgi:hypothetical protein
MYPHPDDVLVSRLTARTDHEVSAGPTLEKLVFPNHDSAVAKAHELARQGQVDLWLTEDHTHFLRLASYRQHQPDTGSPE